MLEMQRRVYEWAESKGWEPDPQRTFGDECALLHSEVSEALEAYRMWGLEDRYKISEAEEIITAAELEQREVPEIPKPEGVASEFADVLIRLLHYCEAHEIDLGAEFEKKMAYNETRAFRHGGKLL